MNDIGEDLLKQIRLGFAKELKNQNSKLAKIIEDVEKGKANFESLSFFSSECGNLLSNLIANTVTQEKLPNGKLYYNIANTFLTGSLKDNYSLINCVAQAIQKTIDKKDKINIEPQKAKFPTERVQTIVNSVADETASWQTVQRRLDAPVKNVTDSFCTDYVKANAEFRSNAGLKPKIIRKTDGKCCEWCNKLAGEYDYPDNVPEDIYRKHDKCHCNVWYINGKKKQDVWTKKKYTITDEERKELLEKNPKPEKFSREKAKELEEKTISNNEIKNKDEFKNKNTKALKVMLRNFKKRNLSN